MILAAKDENGISVVSAKDVTITSADGTGTIILDGIDGEKIDNIRLYLWDGFGTLKPLATYKKLYDKQ